MLFPVKREEKQSLTPPQVLGATPPRGNKASAPQTSESRVPLLECDTRRALPLVKYESAEHACVCVPACIWRE